MRKTGIREDCKLKKYGIAIEYIYRSVQTGILKQGDFLPSVRVLAKQIGISTSPVYVAYAQLEENGIVASVERKGFRLINTEKIPLGSECACAPPPIPIPDLLRKYSYHSNKYDIDQIGNTLPSNLYFPNEELGRCLSRAARKFQNEMNSYGFAHNKLRSYYYPENETAQYIFRIHGISVPAEENCHTGGANEAIRYALRALTKPGDTVAVESPGFLGVYMNMQHLHLRPLEIPTVFPFGLDLDVFEQHLSGGARPKCLIVTPNFQNPTGSTMPLACRVRLLDLCRKYHVVIIEDDVLGALRFGERMPSLKEQMPDDVIYVSSYSKTFAPGYRVGWAAGGKYSFNIRALHMIESTEDTLIGHLAITEYIKSGKYMPLIKNLRTIYRENCEQLTACIREFFPQGTGITEPEGGQYLWITLPNGISTEKLFDEALTQNILIAPGNLFRKRLDHDRNMRICYSMPITQQIIDTIEILGNLIKSKGVK